MRRSFAVLISCSVAACTFVPLDPGAEQVRIESAQAVVGCERKGTTNVVTKHKLGFVPRSADIVTEELTSLARNDAVRLGGNTIVAEAAEREGQQSFAIYRCRR